MGQFTITTTAQLIASGPNGATAAQNQNDDYKSYSFVVYPGPSPTAERVKFVKNKSSTVAPDSDAFSTAGRFPIASSMLNYELEPGMFLWAKTDQNTQVVDTTDGGER